MKPGAASLGLRPQSPPKGGLSWACQRSAGWKRRVLALAADVAEKRAEVSRKRLRTPG